MSTPQIYNPRCENSASAPKWNMRKWSPPVSSFASHRPRINQTNQTNQTNQMNEMN